MNFDSRGSIIEKGNVLSISNAYVEEVSLNSSLTGYILISYASPMANGMISIELLRLNINRNTVLLNESGTPVTCLCDIQKGMWVDTLFSPAMTRSIPPQTNAILVVVKRNLNSFVDVTTNWIASVDLENGFLYTGNPYDINSQTRFVITDSTVISDRNGNLLNLRSLNPGQMVSITHANFQTASIPPQTTAFHVQLLS